MLPNGRIILHIATRRLSTTPLNISEAVRHALNTSPTRVVALESTVITHGLPRPRNLETAKCLEAAVEAEGAIPATIALLHGRVHVGLEEKLLEELADVEASMKISKREISTAAYQGLTGGTTVGATATIAAQCGISIFATGGLGGVHRDVSESLDISADLRVLAETPVNVVCAGVKSILDVGKTLEFLETESVPVLTLGSESFPGFFSTSSGYKSPLTLHSCEDVAGFIQCHRQLGSNSGVVIAQPVPVEFDLPGISTIIDQAMVEARNHGVSGKQVTPFILDWIHKVTDGRSVETNIALLRHNAITAAKIGVALDANARQCESNTEAQDGGTYEGAVFTGCGGVGRNMADALTRLGVQTKLFSAVGHDVIGQSLLERCGHMDTSAIIQTASHSTAVYHASLDHQGSVLGGVMQSEVLSAVTPENILKQDATVFQTPQICVLDGNIPTATIGWVLERTVEHGIDTWFDPTDQRFATKPIDVKQWESLSYFSPNWKELQAVCKKLNISISEYPPAPSDFLTHNQQLVDAFRSWRMKCLLITADVHGVYCLMKEDRRNPICSFVHFSSPPLDNAKIYPSGSGDCLNAAVIACLLSGRTILDSVAYGLDAARVSLCSSDPVPAQLHLEMLEKHEPDLVVNC